MEKNVLHPLTSHEGLFTGRVKLYSNREGGEDEAQILICDKPIFNPSRLEKRKPSQSALAALSEGAALQDEEFLCQFALTPLEFMRPSEAERSAANFERSCRRAKARLYDIVMCTHSFKYFVTLTISPETADRTDYNEIIKKLNTWLDNKVRRNGLCYALVPEFHADGKSIHFHGFFNSALELVDSDHRTKDGKIVYNIPSFKFGHNTAIEITGEYIAACRYILKYVGKSGARVGARFYLSGGALGAPRYEYFNAHINDLDSGKVFTPQGSGLTFRVDKKL